MERAESARMMLGRGVYRAPYLVKGCPALVAIDSRRCAVKHFVLRPATDEDAAWDAMERWLERFDPAPQLRLVSPFARPTPIPKPTIAPSEYETHLQFALRRARAAAKRMPSLRHDA